MLKRHPPDTQIADVKLKKHHAVIQTDGSFTFLQRQLYNYLLLQAYPRLLTDRTHQLPVAFVMFLLGWPRSENTQALKEALSRVVSAKVEFNILDRRGKEQWQSTTLMSWAEIEGGMLRWRYDEAMAQRLHNPSYYATICMSIQDRMSSRFALPLYENCLRFVDQKSIRSSSTGWWTIDELKRVLGAHAPIYKDFKYLSRDVLKPAIREINQCTDIEIQPEYERAAGRVARVRFDVKLADQSKLFEISNLDAEAPKLSIDLLRQLERLGVGRNVMAAMSQQYPTDAISAAVESTLSALGAGRIKSTAAGYLAGVLKNSPAVTSASFQASAKLVDSAGHQRRLDEEAAARFAEDKQAAEVRERRVVAQSRIDSMSKTEKERYAEAFLRETPAMQEYFLPDKGQFTGKGVMRFKVWLLGAILSTKKIEQ
jgi:plasmid replication initiation protein